MCLIKDGPFSPIRLFYHKYIEQNVNLQKVIV
jgi:hypothetical protein